MSREILVRVFFFAVLLFLLAQLYDVLESFLKPIAWATLLALVFQPVYVRTLRWTGGRRGLASGLLTVAIVLVVAGPAAALSGVLAREAAGLVAELSRWSESGGPNQILDQIRQTAPGRLVDRFTPRVLELQINFAELARSGLGSAGNLVVSSVGGIAKNLAAFFLNLFFVLFTLFFLFRDGDLMIATARSLVPMQVGDKDRVLARLREMLEAVVRGMVITAGVQGLITGIGLLIAGVPYAAFLTLLAAVVSMLPFGSVVIWLGASIYLFIAVSIPKGIFLVLWGTLVVSSIDNFLRPLLIGGKAQLPTLLLFFGMLGGLETYGFLGLFLGPALMATLAAFLEIYREEYQLAHEPVPRSAGPPDPPVA